ncbi:hypothetical protein [Capnocytophaga canimorsus]|uniref:hypothetical protein n=1 Tax=Capnocytophaga canimorsus TaxID=28188 RepID=UPI00385FE337
MNDNKFFIKINIVETIIEDFPKYSYHITEYIWSFLEERILKPKKIWLEDKYVYYFGIIINKIHPQAKYFQENVFNSENVKFLTPKFSTSKGQRQATLFIKLREIDKNMPPSTFALLIYHIFASLILVNNKKLSKEDFDREKENLDFDLINSFPFPVTLEEAQYQIFPDLS